MPYHNYKVSIKEYLNHKDSLKDNFYLNLLNKAM